MARRMSVGLAMVLCLSGAALVMPPGRADARGKSETATAATPTATFISAGLFHTCARTSDGAAWCWGFDSSGQLGDGGTTERHRPVRVTKAGATPLAAVTSVSAGDYHSCARTSDDAAWCWGQNADGRLGDGTTTERHRAVQVTKAGGAPLTGVTTVSAGFRHSCARTSDGAAWCWGDNEYGAIGDGTGLDRLSAVRVTKAGGAPLTGVTSVSAGYDFSCARTGDGAAWCWGDNGYDQLGGVSGTERHAAVRVTKAGGAPLAGVTAIDEGGDHACAQTADGAAWCWGDNSEGQLGDGSRTSHGRAARVTKAGSELLAGVTAISAGFGDSCARTSGGVAWCWGWNGGGQLGDGTTTDRLRAVRVVPTWASMP